MSEKCPYCGSKFHDHNSKGQHNTYQCMTSIGMGGWPAHRSLKCYICETQNLKDKIAELEAIVDRMKAFDKKMMEQWITKSAERVDKQHAGEWVSMNPPLCIWDLRAVLSESSLVETPPE